MKRALVVLALAGCPGGGGGTTPVDHHDPIAGATADAAPAATDAKELDEDTELALIGGAMTQLSPVANQCWAAGAVDDYQLAGTVTLDITPRPGGAKVALAKDTTEDKVLIECLSTVTEKFHWPEELYGETIELPFEFHAPHGQFVIDRRLVPMVGQAGVGVSVLLDQANSGNAAASMLEVQMKDGATVAMAKVDRHEVWYVTGGKGRVSGPGPNKTAKPYVGYDLATGTVIDVPAGAYREVAAANEGLSAVVFLVPGQREGIARGGAMPGDSLGEPPAKSLAPRAIAASKAKDYKADKRVVHMYLDSSAKGAAKDVALSVLELDAGAAVPAHVHADETEMLYVMAGDGSMVIDGVTLPVTDTTVVQIPKGIEHQATVTTAMRAIQLYTPGGPEQRFKAAAK